DPFGWDFVLALPLLDEPTTETPSPELGTLSLVHTFFGFCLFVLEEEDELPEFALWPSVGFSESCGGAAAAIGAERANRKAATANMRIMTTPAGVTPTPK